MVEPPPPQPASKTGNANDQGIKDLDNSAMMASSATVRGQQGPLCACRRSQIHVKLARLGERYFDDGLPMMPNSGP